MREEIINKLLDSIISKLELKAKTTNWIYETYYRTQKLKPLTEWVRLVDVKNVLEELMREEVEQK